MITQFREQNLLSSPFTGKNSQFLTQTNTLLTPTCSRVTAYDLTTNTARTLSIHTNYDIELIAISPLGNTLCIVDKQNYLTVAELAGNTVLCQIKNKFRVTSVKYSPDGKLLALSRGNQLIVYKAPTLQKQLNKLEQIKKIQNKHNSEIKQFNWSPDSRFILSWGKDNSVILNPVFQLRLYNDIVFQSHKIDIVSAFFIGSRMRVLVTLDQLGKMCIWRWVNDYISDGYKMHQSLSKQKKMRHTHKNTKDEEIKEPYTEEELENMTSFEKNSHNGRFVLAFKRHLKEIIGKNFGKIKSCEFHIGQKLLMIGQKNGNVALLRFEDENQIASETQTEEILTLLQSFSATESAISNMSFNQSGEWIALGIRSIGQLIIWEWRSQTQILSQQQLSYETTVSTASNKLIATGSVSGAVRLWDIASNMCIARFDAQKQIQEMQSHISKVTGLVFVKNGVLASCSLDGTVRVWDTIRLKCFRILKTENVPNQLQCIAADPSGDLICAGGFDPYEIYCWQIQTGQLIEVVAGHNAPVTQLKFALGEDGQSLLVSASWDKTVRLHDLYARTSRKGAGEESFEHNSEITALDVRHDGRELVTATMKGELLIWNVREANIIGTLDVDRDCQGGRSAEEMISAQHNQNKRHFTTLAYSKDGKYVIGGGNSKFLCIYDTRFRILLRKFIISQNLSLDGMKLKVDFNKSDKIIYSDEEERKDNNLPGAKTIDPTKRSSKKIHVQIHSVEFSQSNQQFMVAHSEGVSIYGAGTFKQKLFDPLLIDETITITSIKQDVIEQRYIDALSKSLKLNVIEVTLQVYNVIPNDDVSIIVAALPEVLVPRLISTINQAVQNEKKIERDLRWVKEILLRFGIRNGTETNILNQLIELQKIMKNQFSKIDQAASSCIHKLEFFKIQQEFKNISLEQE